MLQTAIFDEDMNFISYFNYTNETIARNLYQAVCDCRKTNDIRVIAYILPGSLPRCDNMSSSDRQALSRAMNYDLEDVKALPISSIFDDNKFVLRIFDNTVTKVYIETDGIMSGMATIRKFQNVNHLKSKLVQSWKWESELINIFDLYYRDIKLEPQICFYDYKIPENAVIHYKPI
ncbi:hypothetical protein WA158_001045 [Blastocystis sp. Blastoise]